MSVFTEGEIAYLTGQPLGRFATVDAKGRPSARPVGVVFDPAADALVVGGVTGSNMAGSKKFRDVLVNPDVSFVVDDLASVDPWLPRGVEVRGVAETFLDGGVEEGLRLGAPFPFEPAWIRIRPRRIVSWGLTGDAFANEAREVI
ncbi:PPOX class F420-dependent oxidoreductase [Nonomuraea longicatena]|uniref:PPOX class F420-dependent oxidoreductase n=1 Tax=Nonomuraea longicatena TaxID=83682 RepID=A0ABP4A066_9ACTN